MKPLGLPVGSVRAIMALAIVAVTSQEILSVLLEQDVTLSASQTDVRHPWEFSIDGRVEATGVI